jgi:hypothetical protein
MFTLLMCQSGCHVDVVEDATSPIAEASSSKDYVGHRDAGRLHFHCDLTGEISARTFDAVVVSGPLWQFALLGGYLANLAPETRLVCILGENESVAGLELYDVADRAG